MNRMLEYAITLLNEYRDGRAIPDVKHFKLRAEGLVSKMQEVSEKYKVLRDLAEERHSKYHTVTDIIILTDDLALSEVSDKGVIMGYFPIVNGRVSSTYSADKEGAILIALGEKYDGLNSQFSYYASKMLGRNLE